MYEITVDSTRCQGHARCVQAAPELFDFDDEGYAFVPPELQRQPEITPAMELARRNCPEQAVVITQVDGDSD